MAVDPYQVEQFLYREARLADENCLDDWLELWSEDGIYWVPCNKDDVDPGRELSIIYDNYARMRMRVERLKSGLAWTQEPPSRMRRMLSNIEIEEDSNGEIKAYSNFHLSELRVNTGVINTWIGRTEHHLLPESGSFKIRLKKVMLLNNDEEMTQLSFLI